jgi:hypothetical protein
VGTGIPLRQNAEGIDAEITLIKEHRKAYDFSSGLNLKLAARRAFQENASKQKAGVAAPIQSERNVPSDGRGSVADGRMAPPAR